MSSHDVSEGGVIGAIFEMCVGGGMGAVLDNPIVRPDNFLFNETAGCFIVEVENESIAKQLFKNVPFKILGKTQKMQEIEVKDLFKADVSDLKRVWQEPMRRLFS